MGNAYSARQSTFGDGDVITAALFNNEFDQILLAFNLGSGHTHDGSAGEGGPITKLLGQTLTFGTTGSASDVTVTFTTSGNSGLLTWDQSADKFIFADSVDIAGNLNVTGTADFGDADFTNVGIIALDSIKGDEDADTSITFSGSDVITMATGGTTRFVVNSSGVAVTGTSTLTGATTVDGDLTVYHEDSDSDGTVAGPTLTIQRKTSGAHPQVNDNLGQIIFKGEDGGGVDTDYIKLLTSIADATAGSEDAKFAIQGIKGGANKNIALFRSGLISFGQRDTNESQPVEFNGPFYSRVGGLSGSRFVHSEQGLNLQGKYTVPIKNSRTIDTITNTSAGTACLVTTDLDHGFSDNMLLYVNNTGISLLDDKSFFIMTVTGQPKQLTLHNAYDGADPQHSGATSTSGNIGGLGYGLRIHNTQDNSAHEQDCHIELGGNDDVFIDLKKPNGDDYDLRLAHLSNNTSYLNSKTGDLVLRTETNGSSVLLQHEGANTKLQTTDTGVTVTGTVTAGGITSSEDINIAHTKDLVFRNAADDGDQLVIKTSGNTSYIQELGSDHLWITGDRLILAETASANDYRIIVGDSEGVKLYADDTNGVAARRLKTTANNVTLSTGNNGSVVDIVTVSSTGIDVTGEVKGDSLDIDGNAALTGTVTIDPPLVKSAPQGLGAKGIIMKQGDLRMKVDGNYDSTSGADVLGGSLQNNSRIIFDSEQHEHIQYEGLGYQKPAFVIQANYNHNAANPKHAGHSAGEEYLEANISQLGLGNLNISAGKLHLKGKLSSDTSTADSRVAGDGYLEHDSYMAITIDGDATNGSLTNLHFGKASNSEQNIRLQPSAGGIVVEGMGTAGSPSATKTNSGTIGTFNDEDLLTLANQKLTIKGDTTAGGIGDTDHALVVEGAVTIKGTNAGGQLIIENSGTSGSDNPDIVLFNNNTGSGADGDKLGGLHFYGKDSAGSQTNYGVIAAEIVESQDGSTEASKIVIRPRTAGSAGTDILTIGGTEVQVPDDIKMAFGDNSDLVISHKSANGNSVIKENGSGNLILQADDLTLEDTNGNHFIKGVEGGAVQIWHNAASYATAKLVTTATGIDVNGTVTASSLTASLTVAVESAAKDATAMTALIGKRIIHTGGAVAYTMPDVGAGDLGKTWTIMNNGTGSLTINRTTNSEFFELVAGQTSSATTSITLVKGGAAEFIVQEANKIVVVGSGI